MGEYIDRGFRDHATIFPVINYHLFNTAVTKASLSRQLKVYDALAGRIKTLEQQAAKRGGGAEKKGGKDKKEDP